MRLATGARILLFDDETNKRLTRPMSQSSGHHKSSYNRENSPSIPVKGGGVYNLGICLSDLDKPRDPAHLQSLSNKVNSQQSTRYRNGNVNMEKNRLDNLAGRSTQNFERYQQQYPLFASKRGRLEQNSNYSFAQINEPHYQTYANIPEMTSNPAPSIQSYPTMSYANQNYGPFSGSNDNHPLRVANTYCELSRSSATHLPELVSGVPPMRRYSGSQSSVSDESGSPDTPTSSDMEVLGFSNERLHEEQIEKMLDADSIMGLSASKYKEAPLRDSYYPDSSGIHHFSKINGNFSQSDYSRLQNRSYL
ncbi:hypothetical protein HK096_007300, partial [Nowakowskiella sp. JEL0078]